MCFRLCACFNLLVLNFNLFGGILLLGWLGLLSLCLVEVRMLFAMIRVLLRFTSYVGSLRCVVLVVVWLLALLIVVVLFCTFSNCL